MNYLQYKFIGLDGFTPIAEELYEKLTEFFVFRNEPFEIAIEEAVCNAGRYSVYGVEKAKIVIKVRLTDIDVTVQVISKTKPFDTTARQKELRKLAADSRYADMEWGDYVGSTTQGCGIWYMLTAVDYLCIDARGQCIALSKSKEKNELITKIGALAPRFLVKQGGGMIL